MRAPERLVLACVLGLVSFAACADSVRKEAGEGAAPPEPARAVHFERTAMGRVRPMFDSETMRLTRHAARVELPERTGEPARVELVDWPLAVEITLLDAAPVAGLARAGTWAHSGAAPGGGDVTWRPRAEGVEDHVDIPTRQARERLEYRVKLEGVAGLRLVSDSLELLDAEGTPRLRMGRPWVLDSTERRHFARVELSGCSADTDPRPPWGRAVTPAGGGECVVRVDWSDANVVYPIVVDPAWTSTGNMAEARDFHRAVRLPGGRVMVAGGRAGSLNTAGVEIFDPATNTFATTGPMTAQRVEHGLELLSDGRVLACGSWSSSTAELWNPSTGTWAATGSMSVVRNGAFTTLRLASGKVLVAGGTSSLVSELFDPSTGSFAPSGNLKEIRYYDFASTLLKDGRVFIVGGGSGGWYSATGEIYDPASGAWTLTAAMMFGRSEHQAILLDDSRVLVPGGVEDDAIKYSDIYDPATDKWSPTPNLKMARRFYAGGRLGDGRVLIVGGEILVPPWYSEKAEIYDPVANTWSFASSMAHGRWVPTFTALLDGGALVAGGYSDAEGYLDSAEVFRFLANGAACSIDIDCSSRHCVDGVCCATDCSGVCQACSAAAKAGGADGVCGPAKTGTGEAACSPQADAPCGYVGACDGQGACAFATQGTSCAPKQCASGALSSFACNGLGACTQSSVSCAPYVCGTQTSCSMSCTSDAGCASSAWCDTSGICKPDLDTGSACTSFAQCKSGFCVDGFCCDKACGGVCEACSTAKKGGGANGTCQPVGAGSDPDSDCPDDGASSCQRDGTCDGAGACRAYPAGTTCAPAGCAGNKPTTYACDGKGTCAPTMAADCGAYRCAQSGCTTSCASNAECAPTARCSAGQCVPLSKQGEACELASECQSGFCIDGVCCNTLCDGQCEACDVPGGQGHCVPVAGAPRGKRPACSKGDLENPCSAAACDGVERKSCKDYVGSAVACRSASCSSGIETLAAMCDGSGQCPAAVTKSCAPYTCAGDACATSCKLDTECTGGATCDTATSKCVTPSKCLDEGTVLAPNGTEVDCAPFRCENGACLTSCTSIQQCAATYVCGSSGLCEGGVSTAESEQSSGCALGRSARQKAPWSLGVVALLLALRRRGNQLVWSSGHALPERSHREGTPHGRTR